MKRDVLIKIAKRKVGFWDGPAPIIGGVIGGAIGGGLGGRSVAKDLDTTGLTDEEIKRRKLKYILGYGAAGGVGGGVGGYITRRLIQDDRDLNIKTEKFKRRADRIKRDIDALRERTKKYSKPVDIGHLVKYKVYD